MRTHPCTTRDDDVEGAHPSTSRPPAPGPRLPSHVPRRAPAQQERRLDEPAVLTAFEVRRASSGTVLATYGSAGSPAAWTRSAIGDSSPTVPTSKLSIERT